jgi:valyl-tRNA synthetase
VEGAFSFIVGSTEFYIPFGEDQIDKEAEIDRLKRDLEYARGFLSSVLKKLENEKFVSSAPPQVVEMERKKKADTEAKIRVIEDQIAGLTV